MIEALQIIVVQECHAVHQEVNPYVIKGAIRDL